VPQPRSVSPPVTLRSRPRGAATFPLAVLLLLAVGAFLRWPLPAGTSEPANIDPAPSSWGPDSPGGGSSPCPPRIQPVRGVASAGLGGALSALLGALTESGACPTVQVTREPFVPKDLCPEFRQPPSSVPPKPSVAGPNLSPVGALLAEIGVPSLAVAAPPSPEGEEPATPQGGAPSLDSPWVTPTDGSLTRVESDLVLSFGPTTFRLGRSYRSGVSDYESVLGLGWEPNVLQRLNVTTDANGVPTTFWAQEGNGLYSGALPGFVWASAASPYPTSYSHGMHDRQLYAKILGLTAP